MKSIKKFFTIFSVVLFSCVNIQSVMALSKDDIGTTTAQFLKLGIGAQSAGMGNAVTCVANGTDSIYSNPANLNYLEKIELSFSHTMWFEDVNYEWFAIAIPTQKAGTFGLGLQYVSYGSLDKFVKKETPNDIANMFNSGKYKLIQVGRAFAYDYLKRVGVNTCKKSSQLERLFGSHRLGIVENANATEQQVLNIIKKIAILNNCDEIIVESIIQQFCLLRSANICGENPNCERCKIRNYCHYNKKYDEVCN